jgi:OmcA/MtrC family decaheme c-type cytochrome
MVPNRDACGSCHDDVNFDTGANHGPGNVGGSQPTNQFCAGCHPSDAPGLAPVMVVHRGVARATEGALYAGGSNGFAIEDLTLGPASDEVTIDFSVTKQGVGAMDLATAPEWTAGGGASRLAITVGWNTFDYTNEGTSATPASPPSIDGLDVGGVVTDNLDGTYSVVATLPRAASDTITASIEGHPAADLDGDGTYSDRIAVTNDFMHVDIEQGRATEIPRRDVVDVSKCNQCHGAAGQGISLHGNNRTGEIQVCVVCHNANNTDINRRPADPNDAPDGKVEESVDFKRMIHQIHTGADLENGLVIYGFGNSVHDFGKVGFIGNRQNCETCHDPGTYGTADAWDTLPSTISTGADVADPDDDLNISPTAAVCSACHDGAAATDHMKLHGASFIALDEDIQ